VGHDVDELVLLLLVRQLAVQQQVADLEEVAVLGELLDRVAAVEQHARVAIDVRNGGRAARGRHEARVVGEVPGLAVQRAHVDDFRADRPGHHRQVERLAVRQLQSGFLVHGFP
jgi:hypothetical protein